MIAAVYLRVSTERQDEANQEPDTRRICAARGWEPAIYRERESGAKRRPQWDLVKEAARQGKVGAVVFWSLDRIGRDRVQAAHDLRELFRWNVTLCSVKEPWLDQSGAGPLRSLLVDVVTWFAESERARLIERTHAGLAAARARGVRLGRPPAMSEAARARAAAMKGKGTPGAVRRLLLAEGLGDFPRRTVQRAMEG